MIFFKKMYALDYINETRAYLDYLEEHINNVSKAFDYLSEACNGLYWVGDDYLWHTLRYEIENHDLSKFSKEEFTQYRASFYPVSDDEKESSKNDMVSAWEHHKESNHHHHETVVTYIDLVHMIIDWTAMGFKFGGTAKEYYEKNHKKMNFSKVQIDNMYEIFNKIEEYKSMKMKIQEHEKPIFDNSCGWYTVTRHGLLTTLFNNRLQFDKYAYKEALDVAVQTSLLEVLASIYEKNVCSPAGSERSNQLVIDAFADCLPADWLTAITDFLQAKYFIFDRVKNRRESKHFFRQPASLLTYYLTSVMPSQTKDLWPLDADDLALVFSDLGKSFEH